jgi:hypothetical protein
MSETSVSTNGSPNLAAEKDERRAAPLQLQNVRAFDRTPVLFGMRPLSGGTAAKSTRLRGRCRRRRSIMVLTRANDQAGLAMALDTLADQLARVCRMKSPVRRFQRSGNSSRCAHMFVPRR